MELEIRKTGFGFSPQEGISGSSLKVVKVFRENLVTNDEYQNTLQILGQGGVKVMGVALGDIENEFMTTISSRYMKVKDYTNPANGMASQFDPSGPLLYQTTTNQGSS